MAFRASKKRNLTRIDHGLQELAKLWINIFDFLGALRSSKVDLDADTFIDLSYLSKGSLEELRRYSKANNLLYPLDLARGTVLTGLLVHMF